MSFCSIPFDFESSLEGSGSSLLGAQGPLSGLGLRSSTHISAVELEASELEALHWVAGGVGLLPLASEAGDMLFPVLLPLGVDLSWACGEAVVSVLVLVVVGRISLLLGLALERFDSLQLGELELLVVSERLSLVGVLVL